MESAVSRIDWLFSEYDQKTKFYNKKKELVHAEIMLPSYALPGYADRATLWNAVEAVENQWNSQLARRIVLEVSSAMTLGDLPGGAWDGSMISAWTSSFFLL